MAEKIRQFNFQLPHVCIGEGAVRDGLVGASDKAGDGVVGQISADTGLERTVRAKLFRNAG